MSHMFKSDRKTLFLTLAVVFLALLAGAIGGIFIQNFVSSGGGGFSYALQRVVWRMPSEDIGRLSAQLVPSIVKLYRPAPSNNLGADIRNSYFSDDLVGAALVLTADGWLLTFNSGSDFFALRALAYNREGYKIEKVVRDGFSHLVFLKIRAENLTPARFGDDRGLASGDYLFLPDDDDNLLATSLVTQYAYSENRGDLIRFSDVLNRRLTLRDSFKKNLVGMPIFNINGEAVGIFSDNGNYGVPLEVIKPILSSFLKSGVITRPGLGVYYANLSLLKNQALWQNQKSPNGALIWRSGETPFASKSAGRTAGLRLGDIIIKVESDNLNARHDLAEMISEYEIGTVVNLTVIRGGQEIKVPVTLK